MSQRKHAGKTVLVTGGARGIGLAIARRFAAEGADLALFDLAADALEAARDALVAGGDGADGADGADGTDGTEGVEGSVPMIFAGSVAAPDDVERCFAMLDARWQRLDVLVNCAGILVVTPAVELDIDAWRDSLDVNLTGTWLTCRAAGARMIRAGGGAIVNISSVMGNGGAPERAAYCASKAGVIGLTRSLAVEWGRHGVRVNSVAPTATRTDLVQNLVDRGAVDRAAIADRTPLRRMAEPDEVAAVCSFLASEDAAMISGHDLAVDGGWMANYYI